MVGIFYYLVTYLFLLSVVWIIICMPICTMFVSWSWPLLLDRWPSICLSFLAVTPRR